MSSPDLKSHLEEDVFRLDGHDDNDKNPICSNSSYQESQGEKKKFTYSDFIINTMFNLLKEFLVMVLVAIVYSAITNDPPKVGKSPAAYRFFSEDSPVTDWYRGEVGKAISQARTSDIAFVMFYAPWDAESQHARKQFEIAANVMHNEIKFIAVNCWQPGSECRNQYSKVYKWPVFIVYPTHGRGIQYNGYLLAPHMLKFLLNVKSPVVRLYDEEGLGIYKYISEHNAVILGKVNSLPNSFDYTVFYVMAVRLLEKDPFRDIVVVVQTVPEYDEYGLTNLPSLQVFLWNETLIYPSDNEWNVDKMLNWILNSVHQVSSWISPNSAKSLVLSSYIQPGPALILFTPKNPLWTHNHYYNLLREIGYEYYTCNENNILFSQEAILNGRIINTLDYFMLTEKCAELNMTVKKSPKRNVWSNSTSNSYCRSKRNHFQSSFFGSIHTSDLCGGEVDISIFSDLDKKECENCNKFNSEDGVKTSMLTDFGGPKPTESLSDYHFREKCKFFYMAELFEPTIIPQQIDSNFSIKGLSCKTNKSLSLIALDSLQYHHLAEKLGVDLSTKVDKTAVVVLNDKMESHYVMEATINEDNLRKFIFNFTQNWVPRALTSFTSVKSKNTHSYPIKRNVDCVNSDSKICVTELSHRNFVKTLMQPNKAVIVFYYSKQCSYCNGISYKFLTAARHLSAVTEIIFARIDGDLNLLPWEFTMESYPTILFVPSNRKSESRVFPINLPITVPNIIGFILNNVEPSLKLETMWALCGSSKFSYELSSCIGSLRIQILTVIEKVLQEWRAATARRKAEVFRKLQHLRSLHLLFTQSTQTDCDIKYHISRLKFIEAIMV